MERAGWAVGRVVLTAVAVAGAVAILIAGSGYDFWAWASLTAVILVAVGALANRSWVVAVPLAAAAVWGILMLAQSGGESQEPAPEWWAILALVLGVAFGLCLIVGVGLRRAARAASSDDRSRLSARASRPRTTRPDSR